MTAAWGKSPDLRDDPTWPPAREAFKRTLPPNPACFRCGKPITSDLTIDHVVPYAECRNHLLLAPAHRSCNATHGAYVGNARKREQLRVLQQDRVDRSPMPTATGGVAGRSPASSDPVWQVPWLLDLLDVPADATWPGYMSAPHPDAVGSLGLDVERWVRSHKRSLRWWQRLAVRRLLEVDAGGHLVWPEVLVSVARQCGKSTLLREVLGWRTMTGRKQFGEAQLILHVSKDEAQAIEVQRPFRVWAKQQADGTRFKVREANGNVSVEHLPTNGRWLVRASSAVFGFAASQCAVDEAWSVVSAVVDDGIAPTMLERADPQLLLTSTAHRKATGLFLDRRKACVQHLLRPTDTLLLEWSADPALPEDDETGWRQASPHWSDGRRKLVARQLEKARAGDSVDPTEPDPMESFRSQYLNRWPATKLRVRRGQDLLAPGIWDGLAASKDTAREREGSPLVMAVEDNFGDGAAAVGVVELSDGKLAAWGRTFGGRTAALAYALETAATYEDSHATVLVGASMSGDPALSTPTLARVDLVGAKEFRTGLPLLRSVASASRLVHDGGEELARQVLEVRVLEGPSGITLVGGQRADMLRCLVWCVQAATIRPYVVPAVY